MAARYVVRNRGGRGQRYLVIDTFTGETVRSSTARAGAENLAAAANRKWTTEGVVTR